MSIGQPQSTSLFGNTNMGLPSLKRDGGTADLTQEDPTKKMNLGGSLFGATSANSTPPGLFGASTASSTPQGTAGTLFGSNTQAQSSSLFGNTQGQNPGMTNINQPNAGQPGSLFGTPNTSQQPQTGSIFGTATAAPGQGQTGSLFGAGMTGQPQAQTTSLFGATTAPAQPQPQAGSLFGGATTAAQPQAGTLFGMATQPPAQTQAGSLFGGATTAPTQAGSLFGGATTAPTQPSSLFGGAATAPAQTQPGSLFGAPTQAPSQPSLMGSLFSGSTPTGTTLFGSLSSSAPSAPQPTSLFPSSLLSFGSNLVKSVVENQFGWRREHIEKLPDPFKNVCFQIQTSIDDNEKYLSDISHIISLTSENRLISRARAGMLVSNSKKIEAKLVRLRRTLDAISKYQRTVSDYTRDFIRICERIGSSDPFLSAAYPAPFLSEMLNTCENKLTTLELVINELEEILMSEKDTHNGDFSTLVSSLQMMHERFQLVCALTAQIHSRVSRCQEFYINKRRELGQLDDTEIIDIDISNDKAEEFLSGRFRIDPKTNMIELLPEKPEKQDSGDNKQYISALKNAISGRVGVMAQKLYSK